MPLSEADWLACYRRLEQPLYNVLFRWTWQREDAEDLMHEAFLRVWDKREGVDATRVDALVYASALNLARNRLRWRELWRFVGFDETAQAVDDPQLDAEQAQAERRLRRALRSLPRGQREVLLLSEFGGLRTDEIANVLGIPAGTVGSRKHQALARLRQLMTEQGT